MVINLKKMNQLLLISAVIITPLLYVSDVLTLLSGSFYSASTVNVFLKGLKDILLAAILAISLVWSIRKKISVPYTFLIFCLTCLGSIIYSLYDGIHTFSILAGLRWVLPVVLFVFFINVVSDDFQKKFGKWMIILFVLEFITQIFQVLFMPAVWGGSLLKYIPRVPGIFAYPSSASIHSLLTLYYILYFSDFKRAVKGIWSLMACVSALITGTLTGVISLVAVSLFLLFHKIKEGKILMVFGTMLLLILLFYTTTADKFKYDSKLHSISVRFEIFNSLSLGEKVFLSNEFGNGTNTAKLAKGYFNFDSEAITADSTITSLLINTGVIGFLSFMWFLAVCFSKDEKVVLFYLIFLPFFITTVLFEMFPHNLVLSLNLAYFYVKKRDKALEKS